MPTVLYENGYRFFFFSREGKEPAHIHVEKAEKYAKFWIQPIQLAESYEFRSYELMEIHKIIEKNQKIFEEKWNEYFSGQS